MKLALLTGVAVVVLAPGAAAQSVSGGIVSNAPPVQRGYSSAGHGGDTFRYDPRVDTAASLRAYSQMLDYGRCAARSNKASMVKALAFAPRSPGESQVIDVQERSSACGPGANTRILSLVRGSFSEGLYLQADQAAPRPVAFESAEYDAFLKGEASWQKLRDPGDQAMGSAADCLVALQPGVADKIVRTQHGSNDEALLMDVLFREAPQCAGPRRPASLSRTFLRAFIAEALYRYAKYTSKPAAG